MFVFFTKKVQSTDLFYVWWRIADSLEQNFIAWDLELEPDFNFSRISPRLFGNRCFACFIFLTEPNTRILEEIALNSKDCKFFSYFLSVPVFGRCIQQHHSKYCQRSHSQMCRQHQRQQHRQGLQLHHDETRQENFEHD